VVVRPLLLKEVSLYEALGIVIFGKDKCYLSLLDELGGKCVYNILIVLVAKPKLMKIDD
jgi:hypothetical protein